MKLKGHGVQTALIVGLVLLVVALPAAAQVSSTNLLDIVVQEFSDATAKWGKVFQVHALRLFFGLAAISMVWTYGLMALKQADISEFIAETIKFLVFLGFFLWLLENGVDFADKILRSLRQMGSEAIGQKDVLTPSRIVDIGFKIFFLAVDKVSVFSPVVSAAALIMSGLVLVTLAYISFAMIKLICAAWIMAYAGVFFLGFGGSRWTSDIAVYYYKTVLGVAAELMTMTLLVGVGQTLITKFAAANGDTINLKSLAAMLIASMLLYVLCDSLPARVASIATGGAVGGSGGGGGMGAAALLAGATMGGLAAQSIAKGVAGGADAVGAALQSAKAAAATGNGPGGIGGIAMGTAGRLASAMGSVAASSASKLAFGTQEDRKKTFGGRMAEQIRQKDAPPEGPVQSSKPGAFGSQAGSNKTEQPATASQGTTPGASSGTSASPSTGGNSFGAGAAASSGGPAAASATGSPKAASPEVEAFARPNPTTNN